MSPGWIIRRLRIHGTTRRCTITRVNGLGTIWTSTTGNASRRSLVTMRSPLTLCCISVRRSRIRTVGLLLLTTMLILVPVLLLLLRLLLLTGVIKWTRRLILRWLFLLSLALSLSFPVTAAFVVFFALGRLLPASFTLGGGSSRGCYISILLKSFCFLCFLDIQASQCSR